MSANALNPSAEDRDRAYRSRVKEEPLPAVVIDCATATVLAANAGGLNALGLTPADRLPLALDSAMPAVAMLRDLQRKTFAGPARHILMFWRHGRTSTRLCDVLPASSDLLEHALILFRPESETSLPPVVGVEPCHDAFGRPAPAANDDCPPRVVRDDAETLKEIARRIREGQARQVAASAEAPSVARETALDLDVDKAPAPPAPPLVLPPADTDAAPEPSPMAADRPAPEAVLTPTRPAVESGSDRPLSHTQRDLMRALPPEDIARLAHELKTPLSAIAAAAEIMRDERLGAMGNDKYLGYASDIHDSATHALAVIADMLAAVPPADRQRTRGGAFDLADLAARSVSTLQPLAGQRGLALSHDADGSVLPVRANPTSVRQILLNLLTNALKFTPPDGDVRVGTGYLDDGSIFLVVRDTGDGMTTDAMSHAFDDTTDATAMRAGGGRGIGLRLVRRLAAENGAEFEIDSEPGRGTVVMLVFPKDLVGEA